MITGTQSNFKAEVLDFKGKVLVDFWASWCGPCQMLSPVMEELNNEFSDKIKIVKVNVDEENEISNQYSVSSIPTVILFVDGQIKETIIGFHQKQDYINLINK